MKVERKGKVIKALGIFTVLDEEDTDVLQRTLEIFYIRGKPVKYTVEDAGD